MPRQEERSFLAPEAAQPKGYGAVFRFRASSVLASVILHAAVFTIFFLIGTGGEIGVAGDGSGGTGVIQVGIVSLPGDASSETSAVSPAPESAVEKTVQPVADDLKAVPIRAEKRVVKEERSKPLKPARPAGQRVTPATRETMADAAAPSPAAPQSGGGAGGGSGHGGMGNAATPGTIAGDGKPFGFSLAEVNSKPGIIKRVSVVYPREARQKRVTGHVLVRFHLDEAGAVSHLSIKNASPPDVFNENTLAAVRQWRFSPAKMGDKAVPVWVELPIEFDLRR